MPGEISYVDFDTILLNPQYKSCGETDMVKIRVYHFYCGEKMMEQQQTDRKFKQVLDCSQQKVRKHEAALYRANPG